MESEEGQKLHLELEDLRNQLAKKDKFEDAVRRITFLLHNFYVAHPSLQTLFYSVVCRVAIVLNARYTSTCFWKLGLNLFKEAESLMSGHFEKEKMKKCAAQATTILSNSENATNDQGCSQSKGYLFEGHLTVDPEPPTPHWLVQSNLVNSIRSSLVTGSPRAPLEVFLTNIGSIIVEETNSDSAAQKAPPASKDAIAKLPVIVLTKEILAELGHDAECTICKLNFVVDDQMQELPCKHAFHPSCIKPWLDEHNSCPICRYELPTDDAAYERWREQENGAREDGPDAASALHGGDCMYI